MPRVSAAYLPIGKGDADAAKSDTTQACHRMSARVLVIGASGGIGAALTAAFQTRGDEVTTLAHDRRVRRDG